MFLSAMDDKDIPNIKISEEGLAKLREELSSEEMRIGLARIQELLLTMRATQHDKEEAKKMLGVTDEELEKIDDDIDMDHGALYLKIELTLKDEFAMTDTKNLNRVIRQVGVCVSLSALFICMYPLGANKLILDFGKSRHDIEHQGMGP